MDVSYNLKVNKLIKKVINYRLRKLLLLNTNHHKSNYLITEYVIMYTYLIEYSEKYLNRCKSLTTTMNKQYIKYLILWIFYFCRIDK